jgi:hypothetical protein
MYSPPLPQIVSTVHQFEKVNFACSLSLLIKIGHELIEMGESVRIQGDWEKTKDSQRERPAAFFRGLSCFKLYSDCHAALISV